MRRVEFTGMDIKDTSILVLLSGGLDSAMTVQYYKDRNCNVAGLFVNYGQLWIAERFSALKVATHFQIPFVRRDVTDRYYPQAPVNPLGLGGHTFVPMRNAFLLCLAIAEAWHLHIPYVAIGSNRSEFPDQTAEFIDRFNFMADYCFKTDERPWVLAPLCTWSKDRIFKFARKHEFPIEITRSCAFDPECGNCQACRLRLKYGVD